MKILTNQRPLALVYQSNQYGTFDTLRNISTLSYTSNFDISSDKTKSDFTLFAYCAAKNNITQTLTIRIYEDDLLVAEKIYTGNGTFNINTTYATFQLPTRIIYKE